MDKKIKVLHLATKNSTVAKLMTDKLKEIEKFGYEIQTMSSGDIQQMDFPFKHFTVKISRKINPLMDLMSLIRIYLILRKNKFHIVHTHTAKAGFVGRVAARLAGVPIVVHTSHGLPFFKGQSSIKNFIYKKLEQVASLFSDGYFSQNKEDLKVIRRMVPSRLLVGYEGNGVHLPRIDQHPKLSEQEKKELKKSLSIQENKFVFLMGARFEDVKNHQMLINALALCKENDSFQVLLAGNGPLLNYYKDKVMELGLEKKVVFLGFRNDILDLMQISDAVLLTSKKEGIPRILMEAMAMSLPVLATDVLGTREVVVHGETGELVQLNDEQKLAKKMVEWADPRYRDKLLVYKRNGRKRIENYFTESLVACRIHRFYEELLKRKKFR